MREFHKKNPDAYGLPRGYKLHFEEPTVTGKSLSSLNSASLVFSRFGLKGGWLSLNGHKIDPADLEFHSSTNTYVFQTKLSIPVDGRTAEVAVSGHFNFDSAIPSGSLHVDHRVFVITLEPMMVKFAVKVSDDAGVYWNSAKGELVWDEESEKWKNASWESSMQFAYGVVTEDDPIQPLTIIENVFTDKCEFTMTYTWMSNKDTC